MRLIPKCLRPTTSAWWPVKAFSIFAALLVLQANPDIFIIVTWIGFLGALAWWAHTRMVEPTVADMTDTQPIPVIRHIRCPRCGVEQFGPAGETVLCENKPCSKKLRVPNSSPAMEVECPMCGTEQKATPGTRHACVNPECQYADFVAWPERIKEEIA